MPSFRMSTPTPLCWALIDLSQLVSCQGLYRCWCWFLHRCVSRPSPLWDDKLMSLRLDTTFSRSTSLRRCWDTFMAKVCNPVVYIAGNDERSCRPEAEQEAGSRRQGCDTGRNTCGPTTLWMACRCGWTQKDV